MLNKDIFDRIAEIKIFSPIAPFYKKHKEILLYLFFGGLTFLVSVVSFALFNISLSINELVANIMSWVIAVLFAFYTNRIWVFNSPTENMTDFMKQMGTFFSGRIITLMIEEVILFVFITQLGFPNMLIKIIAQIIVITTNYIISKLIVFRD